MEYQRQAGLQQEHEEREAEEAAQDRSDSDEAADGHSRGDLNASDRQQLHPSPVGSRADAVQLPQQQGEVASATQQQQPAVSMSAGAQADTTELIFQNYHSLPQSDAQPATASTGDLPSYSRNSTAAAAPCVHCDWRHAHACLCTAAAARATPAIDSTVQRASACWPAAQRQPAV